MEPAACFLSATIVALGDVDTVESRVTLNFR